MKGIWNISVFFFALTLGLAAPLGTVGFEHTALAQAEVDQDFFEVPVAFVTENECTGEFIVVVCQ